MVDALRAKGLPYAYLLFEGEQHGFRKADTIRRAAEAELSFYAQILGLRAGRSDVPRLAIENLRAERRSGLSRRSSTSTAPAARSRRG